MAAKRRNLVKLCADLDNLKEIVCKHCGEKTTKTYQWYYDSEAGYIFCPGCGEELLENITMAIDGTIEKFVKIE